MNNRVKDIWKKFVKAFSNMSTAVKVLGCIFGLTILISAVLLVQLLKLDILPMHFILVAFLAVVFLLTGIYFLLFGIYTGKIARVVARAIGLMLSAGVILTATGGIQMIRGLQNTLSEITRDTQDDVQQENQIDLSTLDEITREPFIIYISGNDTAESMEGVRSDVNILAVVNPVTKQVLLVNTPRDYFVEISVAENGERDKLTHCGIYGLGCSIDTLSNLYGKDINYYAQVSFYGFVSMIDAIGGVTVYNDQDFTTVSGYHFSEGYVDLDGDQALQYVRERKAFEEGDNMRGRHQMDVISAVIKKLSSGALLLNYDKILESMNQYFSCSLTESEIASLVKMQLNDLAAWDVKTFAVTGTDASSVTYTMPQSKVYVMMPEEATVEHASLLMDKILTGQVILEEDLIVPRS